LVQITLFQVNDLYVLEPVDGGQRGGIARLATLVREARRENPHTVFVLAGDTLSPSIESRVLRGAQMVAALNGIGLDLATFGNHEFDFGPDVLRERMAESKFAWLSANVVDRPSGRVFGGARPDLLLTFDGLAVGFLGLTTPETAWVSSPGPDVVFGDPRVTGREAASRLRARGAKLVVAITHQGMAADRALAGAAGLDVVGGRTAVELEAHSGKLTTEETNLGDFVADVMRERLQSDVGLVNGGAIRGNRTVPVGPLTRRDVGSLLPFANVVMKLEMTGRELRQAFEHSLTHADRQAAGFLQAS